VRNCALIPIPCLLSGRQQRSASERFYKWTPASILSFVGEKALTARYFRFECGLFSLTICWHHTTTGDRGYPWYILANYSHLKRVDSVAVVISLDGNSVRTRHSGVLTLAGFVFPVTPVSQIITPVAFTSRLFSSDASRHSSRSDKPRYCPRQFEYAFLEIY